MTTEQDNNTWVYHALYEAKIVKASEAVKLYKKGWRDSPDEKTLFKGIRGKWYKLILFIKKLTHQPKQITFLQWFGVIGSTASIIGLIVALLQ